MVEASKMSRREQEAHLEIDGHKITICFSKEYNPTLAALVKETLIDSFLRKNCIRSDNLTA